MAQESVEIQNSGYLKHTVTPAKAGVHHLSAKFELRSVIKPNAQVMDPRLRGGDEFKKSRHVVESRQILASRLCAALLLLASPATAHAANDYRNFIAGNYEEVIVDGDMQVEILNSNAPSARAEGDAKLVDAVKFVRTGKIVRITLAQPSRFGGKASTGTLKIKLTGRNVRKLSLRGSGLITVDTIKTALGQFDIHGPGEIRIGNLQADKVQVLLSGNGRMSIEAGATKGGAININGTPTFDAPKFTFDSLTLFQQGAASTTATAMRDVTITNNGPGTINIGGKGTCVIRQAGSGTITCPNGGGVK
jgi:Putative auto-transporter adhesin, head GIN domain